MSKKRSSSLVKSSYSRKTNLSPSNGDLVTYSLTVDEVINDIMDVSLELPNGENILKVFTTAMEGANTSKKLSAELQILINETYQFIGENIVIKNGAAVSAGFKYLCIFLHINVLVFLNCVSDLKVFQDLNSRMKPSLFNFSPHEMMQSLIADFPSEMKKQIMSSNGRLLTTSMFRFTEMLDVMSADVYVMESRELSQRLHSNSNVYRHLYDSIQDRSSSKSKSTSKAVAKMDDLTDIFSGMSITSFEKHAIIHVFPALMISIHHMENIVPPGGGNLKGGTKLGYILALFALLMFGAAITGNSELHGGKPRGLKKKKMGTPKLLKAVGFDGGISPYVVEIVNTGAELVVKDGIRTTDEDASYFRSVVLGVSTTVVVGGALVAAPYILLAGGAATVGQAGLIATWTAGIYFKSAIFGALWAGGSIAYTNFQDDKRYTQEIEAFQMKLQKERLEAYERMLKEERDKGFDVTAQQEQLKMLQQVVSLMKDNPYLLKHSIHLFHMSPFNPYTEPRKTDIPKLPAPEFKPFVNVFRRAVSIHGSKQDIEVTRTQLNGTMSDMYRFTDNEVEIMKNMIRLHAYMRYGKWTLYSALAISTLLYIFRRRVFGRRPEQIQNQPRQIADQIDFAEVVAREDDLTEEETDIVNSWNTNIMFAMAELRDMTLEEQRQLLRTLLKRNVWEQLNDGADGPREQIEQFIRAKRIERNGEFFNDVSDSIKRRLHTVKKRRQGRRRRENAGGSTQKRR
jgi:hypothetical protein